MLVNQLSVFEISPFQAVEANAQTLDPLALAVSETDSGNQLGLIAILAENELLNDVELRSHIFKYAQNAQNRIPHSQAFVIGIDKNESTFKIATVLEKMYYEGIDSDALDTNILNNDSKKEDENKLAGIVIVGDVPIPVVNETDGTTHASIYPYTDFYRKRYIYNYQTDKFEANKDVANPNPDIWHGLIMPPDRGRDAVKNELVEYFKKNEAYSNGDPEYTDFEKRMLYANFPAMEKQMNFMDYRNYERYIKYGEEMAFNRYNKNLLTELIKEVSADMGSSEMIMPEDSIKTMLDISTEFIFKKYTSTLSNALKIYRGKLNDMLKDSGRWSSSELDTPDSLISMRDEYAKRILLRNQLLIEKQVNNVIKANVPADERKFEAVTDAKLKIKMTIVGIDADSKSFTFYSYIDGAPVSAINSVKECGIYTGQKRQEGQSVLENNSVYVEANRLYDPASLIEPPDDDDWKLKDDQDYKDYAGCVFNNSIKVETDEVDLDPAKCITDDAIKPLYSIVGSREVTSGASEEGACSLAQMTFHPGMEYIYDSEAIGGGLSGIAYDASLKTIINKAYSELVDDGLITEPADTITQKESAVIKALTKTGTKVKYSPKWEVDVEISAEITGAKQIDSYMTHVEPTNETIKAIKQIKEEPCADSGVNFPQIVTPSTPADGIRYVELLKDGQKKKYEYMDLYRVTGANPNEISDNLIQKIKQKDDELSDVIDGETNVLSNFFYNNSDVIEPIIWNGMGADQKMINVIPKYLDRDSLLPIPDAAPGQVQIPPVIKPDGYEVLHIVADGDALGYQFGLNKKMRPAPKASEDTGEESSGSGGEETGGDEGGGGSGDTGGYMCGDPSGVEIWEWFDALQCWIEEEILPATDLISLDDTCGAQAPAPEEDEENLEEILNPAEDQTSIPSQINVVMGRKSLVVGEEEEIKIYPLNSKGESVYGYIQDPVHLELTNPNIGEFDKNDFNLFSGEESVKFKANNIGSTVVKVTMGEFESTFSIGVYDSVNTRWAAEEKTENTGNFYEISVSLRDPSNNPLENINTDLVVGVMKPSDGKFEKNGKVEIINGNGRMKFYPNPGPTEIKLTVKDSYYSSDPFSVFPPPNQPVTLELKTPSYIPVGGTVDIPVTAVDVNGNRVTNFNNKISVSLQEDTKDYANIITPKVTLSAGKGTIKLSAGKQSGEIQLIAEYTGLKSGVVNIPLLARMESSEWEKIYPQNLFASFVGFPAGDFTTEGYFGGTHLFSGKTEAVFSFMSGPTPPPILTIAPNNKITILDGTYSILTDFPRNKIYLQVFDQDNFKTLLAKTIPLNFKEVQAWGQNTEPKKDIMYLESLNESYPIIETATGLEVRNLNNSAILKLASNNIVLPDTSYTLTYNTQPEFDAMELVLTNGFDEIARVILSFQDTTQNPNDFDEINESYVVDKLFGGKSVKDPNGLVMYNPKTEIQKEDIGEYYGLEGDNKYLKLFAGGSSIGEAVQYNLPPSGILLGDPTIKLPMKASGGLNFDASGGRKIFQDPEGVSIVSINQFDFNNDDYKDVVLVMKDGRVRLMQGGPTDPELKDRGDIALLADGAIAVERFDFKKDGYEDILVATDEGRLAILNNDREVLTRTDQTIKVGKKLYMLLKGDMDNDGYEDLVTLDSKGDIRIFYYDGEKFSENGKLIGNYGFSLKLDQNLYKDLDVRYPGLQTPGTGFGGIDTSDIPVPNLPTPSVTPSSSQQDALEKFSSGDTDEPSESKSQAMFDALAKMAAEARKDPVAAINAGSVPLLPWPETNDTETKADDEVETYFAPVEDVDFVHITKTVSNKERPRAKDLDLEENLLYKIEIKSDISKNNVVLADTVPDSLTVDPKTAVCEGVDCGTFAAEQKSIRLFFAGLNLRAGQTITITYEAAVKNTPKAGMFIQKLTKPADIVDDYVDIVVSPPYNNTGDLIQHYTVGPRDYKIRSTTGDVKVKTQAAVSIAEALDKNKETMAALEDFGSKEYSEDNKPDMSAMPIPDGTCDAVSEAMGNNDCLESADSTLSCANDFLDDAAKAINDFACMGGGCFPIPWNMSFLVPGSYGIALPVFAFPTTLTTPVGPMPFIWPPMILGITDNFAGPIMSMLRFYASPTLTGGLGIAMCWGPYMGSSVAPVASFPIPYPPPVGNCMVTAVPADKLWGGLCGKIEEGINWVVEQINAGINKINSATESANDQNLPVEMTQGNSEEGAGGLEISLGVSLGESTKFDPPAKGFSNIHIPTFDSLMGKISDWFDRQTLEILNKLMTLPTFYIYIPDFKSMFSLDWDRTTKKFNQWIDVIAKSPGATDKTIDSIKEGKKDEKFDANDLLNIGTAVETQFQTYNLNLFQGLYDVVNSLPLVQLTEKPVEFKIPWLSVSEIRAYIIECQNWILWMKREINRIRDIWEKYTCDDPITKASECAVRKVADSFLVNIDPVLESVQKNIEVLQSYLAFPREFVKFRGQLVDYIRGIACYLNIFANMFGGYEAKLKEQVISWAELIATIMEIVKRWKELFNLFINFDTTCSLCTNERYANFGWWMLLGLILPDIPIISFPKLPDIVLDLSDINAGINIEIPMLHLVPEPIPLPPLPYLRLPDIPSINLLLQFPPLPILPSLPEFPDLPELPPIPVVDLPGLPAPPKLPDIGMAFEVIIEILEKILKVWCLIKKSLAPIPESMLNDQITLLTNRPAYITPLDLIKITLPNVALFDLGFNELRIETQVYLGLRVKAISKTLEEAAATWNEWMQNVPDWLNEQYKNSIIAAEQYLQNEVLDYIDELMDNAAQTVEEGFEEGTDMSSFGDDLDAFFRQKEQEWQDWADEQKVDTNYQEYVNSIKKANDTINEKFAEGRDAVDDYFRKYSSYSDYLNYFIPFAKTLEQLDKYDANEILKGNIFDNIDKAFQAGLSAGPAPLDKLFNYLKACIDDEKECNNFNKYFSYTQNSVESDKYAKEIKDMLGEMITLIEKTNKSEMVDAGKIKKDLGVSDIAMNQESTSVNKVKWMEKELLAYSDLLDEENKNMGNVEELYALAKVPPREAFNYELADETYAPIVEDSGERVFTSAVIPKDILKLSQTDTDNIGNTTVDTEDENIDSGFAASAEDENSDGSDYCQGVCLPDPVTNNPTAFIPSLDNSTFSETLFLDSGNAVYSDGSGLYFKKNMALLTPLQNTGGNVPDKIFRLDDDFMTQLGQAPYLMEAVNMLRTSLVENGSASFTWKASTNPNLYGYGIEMERSISGFDSNKQENGLPDTKFVLLPPDETGGTPEVIVDDNTVIPYGTLVTNMNDAEAAQTYFGIRSDNVITGAKKITFKTINNATISVGGNTAMYFDKFTGASYSINNMENGYYHIKMTWFDKYGRISTYNHNELLAPQIYASSAAPIDMSMDKTYYVPVYKEKVIKASTIFMDLSRAYKYYWYVDVDKNPVTPVMGNTLTIPPQPEPKEFLVKLVATKDIRDDSFEKYEKTFKVIVYVPKITLEEDPLGDGIIKGTLNKIPEAKEDDLSGIPFSVFRKRWDTWKNLGILIYKKGAGTNPPLNDNEGRKYTYDDSYYTFATEGQYDISAFDLSYPSSVSLKDGDGNSIAKVDPKYGRIEILNDAYSIKPVSASSTLPTRITVVKTETGEVAASVYYVSDLNTDVSIKETALGSKDTEKIGVTIGDANNSDDIIAKNIPGFAPSMPGGAILYNQTPPQSVVALVDTNGSIRLMKAGYKLKIKNITVNDEPYIFQISTEDDKPVFDVYIQADFGKMAIDPGKPMGGSETMLGMIETPERMFAPDIPKPSADENPFGDLDTAHPYYKQILELYKRRVISGYGDGTFKADSKITRAEFVKIALGVTNCFDCTTPTEPQREKYTPIIPFPDVRLPAWYYFCIWIGKELKMITGYGDGFFRPDRNISRAEAAAVLLRQSGIEIETAPEGAFADVPEYAWYRDYVYTAVNIGLIKQTAGYVFPDEQITRGEFAFMGMGVINIQECREVDSDKDGMPDWWEMENNLDPLFSGDATSDYDLGGLPALQEYQAGKDPNNGLDDQAAAPVVEEEVCPYLDNPNQNDTDMDGIIDVCDPDIDNDGVLNVLGMFDESGVIDEEKVAASDDNCIFIPNPDQADSDFNGIGDACEPFDECPTIPEDMDGVDDMDGCPEVIDELPEDAPGVYVNKGEICTFMDYEADLMEGDIIMTAITDVNTHEILYEASNEVEYKP